MSGEIYIADKKTLDLTKQNTDKILNNIYDKTYKVELYDEFLIRASNSYSKDTYIKNFFGSTFFIRGSKLTVYDKKFNPAYQKISKGFFFRKVSPVGKNKVAILEMFDNSTFYHIYNVVTNTVVTTNLKRRPSYLAGFFPISETVLYIYTNETTDNRQVYQVTLSKGVASIVVCGDSPIYDVKVAPDGKCCFIADSHVYITNHSFDGMDSNYFTSRYLAQVTLNYKAGRTSVQSYIHNNYLYLGLDCGFIKISLTNYEKEGVSPWNKKDSNVCDFLLKNNKLYLLNVLIDKYKGTLVGCLFDLQNKTSKTLKIDSVFLEVLSNGSDAFFLTPAKYIQQEDDNIAFVGIPSGESPLVIKVDFTGVI